MARKSPGATPDGEALADRIETLATKASPAGRLMVVALKDRIAAKVIADIEAGRSEEARQLAQYLGRSGNSRNDAVPIAAANSEGASSNGAPSQREETALSQALRPNDTGQAEAAQKTDQPIVFPDVVGTAPEAIPGPGTPRAQVAVVDDKAPTEISAGLPAFAPIRVDLTFPRNDRAAAERASALRQALMAAKVEVAGLDAVDASRPTPGIGYYFRSDRDAAIAVSHRVEPLLGHVEPTVLELRGKDPPPGTIEIALPRHGAVSDRVHRKLR